ncbi:MAG: Glycosyl hydrolase family 109 protein 1 [Gemmatimonadaceae bacterium]|nr:Glycosyl hydrolase family 109 protein 1 [Gemmatimonadaceae bacterium]
MTSRSDDARYSRRDLLKGAGAASAGFALARLGAANVLSESLAPPPREAAAESMIGVPFETRNVVRIAIVGTGLRGRSVLHEWLDVPGVKIVALADVVAAKAAQARDMAVKAGQSAPELYTAGDHDFERLCAREDIDLVYTATPWEWHVPVVLSAMDHGHHAATEVPAAYTVDDCWRIVDASERSRRHCIMMENCNYGYNEMLVLQMARAGMFGDLKAAGAAYNHDLREILFENRDEGLWRRAHHTLRNSNLYPTHGLGPVAFYFDINRGDRFDTLVSMATPEMGLSRWREEHEPKESERWKEKYVTGDLNISLIRTAKGRVIRLEHDVSSPRPYSRINSLQGTKGIFEDYPPRIYLEGQEGGERYAAIDSHKERFEHPLWRSLGERARSGGHGGMDYIMAWRLVQCMRDGLPPDMDVYDAASWSVPGPLSTESLSKGSSPVEFPDFTRGRWHEART